MRDDIKKYLYDLKELLLQKLEHLTILKSDELKIRHSLNNENISLITELVEKNGNILNKIDALDFDIQQLKDRICEITGITSSGFDNLLNRDEKIFCDIRGLFLKIAEYLLELKIEKESVLVSMNRSLEEMRKNILSLSDTARIYSEME